ncbi:MAG: pantetheine-phosphate adenylyltransferase [Planctomycetota bacterium]
MSMAVYPGSFDPISYGHMNLARRGLKIFDRLIVAVARNVAKETLFTPDERVEMVREVLRDEPNVTVDSFEGMTVDYVRGCGANVMLRGIRTVSDFEYEFQMALINRHFTTDIETMFMMTSNEYSFLSSRFIKEAVALGADVSAFVPPLVETRLREKLQETAPE